MQTKTKHVTSNSPPFLVKPFHCEPIPGSTTSKNIKCQLLSMYMAPWQLDPSSFLCFLSPITLKSLWVPQLSLLHAFQPPGLSFSSFSAAIPPSSHSSTHHTGEQVSLSRMLEGASVLCPKHAKAMLKAAVCSAADIYRYYHLPETEKEIFLLILSAIGTTESGSSAY